MSLQQQHLQLHMRWMSATTSFLLFQWVLLLGSLVVLDGVSTVLDGDSFVLEGVLSLFVVYLCFRGGRPPKEEKVFDVLIVSTSLKQRCQVDCYPVLILRDQVSTVPVASLWVWSRLPDGWTSLTVPRSKRQQHLQVLFVPGQESWMRSGRSGPGRAKFYFPEGL